MPMHNHRIKHTPNHSMSDTGSPAKPQSGEAIAPGQAVSTQQIYNAAWALAKRDWELNRLFNSWYYEI